MIILQIVGTYPITSNDSERSSSQLKRLLSDQRTTMTAERLNHLALMNAHKPLLKDITNDSIIKSFQERQPRRKRFDLPSVSGSFCLFSPSLSISFIFQFNVVPRGEGECCLY